MNRQVLSSSNIASVGYDGSTQTLEIEFSNGHIYQYFDVPEAIYTGILSAPSPGAYHAFNIKGIYRYSRA